MWLYFPVQASLSALVLMVAYMLQQRLRPFLVSRTLSDSLALDTKDIDERLTDARRQSVAIVQVAQDVAIGTNLSSTGTGSTARRSSTSARRRSVAPKPTSQIGDGAEPAEVCGEHLPCLHCISKWPLQQSPHTKLPPQLLGVDANLVCSFAALKCAMHTG